MIAELVDRVLSGDDDAAWELEEATEDDLAVLRPHLVRLLDADVYLPERMFRAAGEDVQREAVARIDMGGTRNFQLFRVLAETRGPVVESAFVRWRKEPPPGIEAGVLASFLADSAGTSTMTDALARSVARRRTGWLPRGRRRRHPTAVHGAVASCGPPSTSTPPTLGSAGALAHVVAGSPADRHLLPLRAPWNEIRGSDP